MRATDVDVAVAEAIEKTQQTVLEAYSRATAETRATLYPKVVLACAMARGDEFGFFGAVDVRQTLGEIAGKPYDTRAFNRHLDELAGPERGNLLQKRSGLGDARYRCGKCGFRARDFHWQCPGCSQWDTYAPKRIEELDGV